MNDPYGPLIDPRERQFVDPFGPFIDARERELEVAKRRMGLPVTVIAAVFCWALLYGGFVLVCDLIDASIGPFAP